MLPAAISAHGERAGRRFIEFFAATIRNRNTRMVYARAVKRFLIGGMTITSVSKISSLSL
jgi:hypothetical protein